MNYQELGFMEDSFTESKGCLSDYYNGKMYVGSAYGEDMLLNKLMFVLSMVGIKA